MGLVGWRSKKRISLPWSNASWCKLECQVSKPAIITTLPCLWYGDTPLTLMSLAFRTQLNTRENRQEILVASGKGLWKCVSHGHCSTRKTSLQDVYSDAAFWILYPIGFEAETRKQRGTFVLENSEQLLLSKFLALFEKMDPDIIVGHQLQEVDLGILLNRMRERKHLDGNRIGRLSVVNGLRILTKGGGFFAERHLIAGRLMCDIANDMGKVTATLTILHNYLFLTYHAVFDVENVNPGVSQKCVNYTLESRIIVVILITKLRSRHGRQLKKALELMSVIATLIHTSLRPLVLRLQMLPLTKELTCLAGNSWARTLSGTRAERNEYILLHEFYKTNIFCPDKYSSKQQKAEEKGFRRRRRLYWQEKRKINTRRPCIRAREGSVWHTWCLLWTSTACNPSIIQEYNICFTTVDRNETVRHILRPFFPLILTIKQAENETRRKSLKFPPLIKNKVSFPDWLRPSSVDAGKSKNWMKNKRATPEDLALWDTKQMALKLTANSMYGCLGYTQSRFYARPLDHAHDLQGTRNPKKYQGSRRVKNSWGSYMAIRTLWWLIQTLTTLVTH